MARLIDSLPGLVGVLRRRQSGAEHVPLRGFFEALPAELDDAMQIDGAGDWRRFLNLALPLGRPALATATIFTFLATWDEYAWALTSITTPRTRRCPSPSRCCRGPRGTQWGLVFAASMIAIVPVIAVFLVFQRHFVQGLTAGAVKG